MPKKQPYGQFCPIARALDLVGDRWSLLIVRELFLGPIRYGALLEALRPISTDVLAKRLRELGSNGVVGHRDDGSYELTDDGRRLAPVLQELARWGAHHLGAPTAEDDLTAARALQMLAVAGADAADGREATIAVDVGELVCTLSSSPAGLTARRAPGADVDAVVRTDDSTLWALGTGGLSWTDAVSSGAVHVEGDSRAAEHLLVGRLPVTIPDAG